MINEPSRVEVLLDGPKRRLVWGAVPGGRFRAREYYEGLSAAERAKFEPAFRRMVHVGRITNPDRFRKEIGDVYCFKSGQHRIACFNRRRDLVLIFGFRKKTTRSRRTQRHLQTASDLRRRFLDGVQEDT